jgi:DNA-binding NtrC family response regulator
MEWVHFLPPDQKGLLEAAASNAQTPVLISGAPGTGKGQIARWIHLHGPRASKAMVIAHHRTSLSRQILEAEGGSLILQEIGEWPLADQKHLLEHVRTGQGARIIATTDQNLEKRSQAGFFNTELLALLSKNRIEMPALGRRTSEFQGITMALVTELSREIGKAAPRVSSDAWTKLQGYDWPGNLRELRNVLKIALTTCQGGELQPSDFPQFGYDRTEFHATREAFERIYLEELLRACNGDLVRAAELSGMPESAIHAKIQKYGLKTN